VPCCRNTTPTSRRCISKIKGSVQKLRSAIHNWEVTIPRVAGPPRSYGD
jgi:hypothetical protein